jgi:beta-N-acetylhexosaminidase
MPLRDMIGQMMLVGFRGTAVGSDCADPGGHPGVRNLGGVILFDRDVQLQTPERNIQSPEQVRALTATLQASARFRFLSPWIRKAGKVRRFREERGFASGPLGQGHGAGQPGPDPA